MMPCLCYDPQVKKTRRLRKVVDETTRSVALPAKESSAKKYGRTLTAWSQSTTWLSSITIFVPEITAGWWVTTQHGDHHRHFAGAEEKFAFVSYERLLEQFLNEVRELRQKKEPI